MCYMNGDGPSEKVFTLEEYMARRKEKVQREQWKHLMYNGGVIGKNLVQLMQEMEAIPPGKSEQKIIAHLLKHGDEIIFCSVVCPDYSVEEQGGEICYTFNSLGDGIGIVASRALKVHVSLAEFFAKQDIKNRPSFVLAMADQEANDQNCRRVGVDRVEFLERLRQSQKALTNQANFYGVRVEAPFLTELDSSRWQQARREAKNLAEKVPRGLLNSARRVRHRLYERWAGRLLKEEQAMAMLLVQVEEYIAVGRYLSSPKRIILGLDPPAMAPFLRHGAGQTPVIYFQRPGY